MNQSNPTLEEQLDVLRRIAERGLLLAQKDLEPSDSKYIDIFQHFLDELHLTTECARSSNVKSR